MFDALRKLLGIGGQPSDHSRMDAANVGRGVGYGNSNSTQPYSPPMAQATPESFNLGRHQGALQVQPLWAQSLNSNPQSRQANLGLQGSFGVPDTSYSGGNDAQAGFPVQALQNLLRRR